MRAPEDLVALAAHGAGEELLGSAIASLAEVTESRGAAAGPDDQWRAGLMLWTALHGLVSLYNDHGQIPWPPLDDLIADTVSLHTSVDRDEVAAILSSSGGPELP